MWTTEKLIRLEEMKNEKQYHVEINADKMSRYIFDNESKTLAGSRVSEYYRALGLSTHKKIEERSSPLTGCMVLMGGVIVSTWATYSLYKDGYVQSWYFLFGLALLLFFIFIFVSFYILSDETIFRYSLDEGWKKRFESVCKSIKELSYSDGLWCYIDDSDLTKASVGDSTPPFVLLEGAECATIEGSEGDLLCLYPDHVFLKYQKKEYQFRDFKELRVKSGKVKYTPTDDTHYADGEICGTQWMHSNKDGSRDRRHKENKEINTYRLSVLTLSIGEVEFNIAASKNTTVANLEKRLRSFIDSQPQSVIDDVIEDNRERQEGKTDTIGTSPKKFYLTLVTCLFLGVLGIHRFANGKLLSGFLQFFTLGGALIWWLFDLIMILTGRFKDENGLRIPNPNKAVTWVVSLVIVFFMGRFLLR